MQKLQIQILEYSRQKPEKSGDMSQFVRRLFAAARRIPPNGRVIQTRGLWLPVPGHTRHCRPAGTAKSAAMSASFHGMHRAAPVPPTHIPNRWAGTGNSARPTDCRSSGRPGRARTATMREASAVSVAAARSSRGFPRLVHFLDGFREVRDKVGKGSCDGAPRLADQDIVPIAAALPGQDLCRCRAKTPLGTVAGDRVSDLLGAGIPGPKAVGLSGPALAALQYQTGRNPSARPCTGQEVPAVFQCWRCLWHQPITQTGSCDRAPGGRSGSCGRDAWPCVRGTRDGPCAHGSTAEKCVSSRLSRPLWAKFDGGAPVRNPQNPLEDGRIQASPG